VETYPTIRSSKNIREIAMSRPKNDYARDYHIERLPIIAARPPQRVEERQHPESDSYFIAVTLIFEACSELKEECQNCMLFKTCEHLHSALSDRGSDRPIKEREACQFVKKFVTMISGRNK
jgi:hypothetical protein